MYQNDGHQIHKNKTFTFTWKALGAHDGIQDIGSWFEVHFAGWSVLKEIPQLVLLHGGQHCTWLVEENVCAALCWWKAIRWIKITSTEILPIDFYHPRRIWIHYQKHLFWLQTYSAWPISLALEDLGYEKALVYPGNLLSFNIMWTKDSLITHLGKLVSMITTLWCKSTNLPPCTNVVTFSASFLWAFLSSGSLWKNKMIRLH